jgi:cytidylate kinase
MRGTNPSLSYLVEEAFQHWEERRRISESAPRPSPAFTIALSREVGTQAGLVAAEVGKLLGWHVYDHDLLERIGEDMGLRTKLLDSVDERQKGWLVQSVEAFLSAPRKSEWAAAVTDSAYVHHLVKVVLALGVHGECIIVGRGAPFILPANTTLRVRLVAPLRQRIATVSRELGIPEQEAGRRVRAIDRERSDFVRDYFLKDPTDPGNYDLVINIARLSHTQSAELIVEALHRLEHATAANVV